jgi:hypothetical protein
MISFRTLEPIPMIELFDGRLDQYEVKEHIEVGTTSNSHRCLTDGENFLWVDDDGGGNMSIITLFGHYRVGQFFLAISQVFGTEIVSDYEPAFWGFNSQEEWDQCMEKISEEDFIKAYPELMKFISGEPNTLIYTTYGSKKIGETAKDLITKDPSLADRGKRLDLMRAIDQVIQTEWENEEEVPF